MDDGDGSVSVDYWLIASFDKVCNLVVIFSDSTKYFCIVMLTLQPYGSMEINLTTNFVLSILNLPSKV